MGSPICAFAALGKMALGVSVGFFGIGWSD